MFCSKCGAAVDNDAKFCGNCGNAITSDAHAVEASPATSNSQSSNNQFATKSINVVKKAIISILIFFGLAGIYFSIVNSNSTNTNPSAQTAQLSQVTQKNKSEAIHTTTDDVLWYKTVGTRCEATLSPKEIIDVAKSAGMKYTTELIKSEDGIETIVSISLPFTAGEFGGKNFYIKGAERCESLVTGFKQSQYAR